MQTCQGLGPCPCGRWNPPPRRPVGKHSLCSPGDGFEPLGHWKPKKNAPDRGERPRGSFPSCHSGAKAPSSFRSLRDRFPAVAVSEQGQRGHGRVFSQEPSRCLRCRTEPAWRRPRPSPSSVLMEYLEFQSQSEVAPSLQLPNVMLVRALAQGHARCLTIKFVSDQSVLKRFKSWGSVVVGVSRSFVIHCSSHYFFRVLRHPHVETNKYLNPLSLSLPLLCRTPRGAIYRVGN